jgi:hypothetical protein
MPISNYSIAGAENFAAFPGSGSSTQRNPVAPAADGAGSDPQGGPAPTDEATSSHRRGNNAVEPDLLSFFAHHPRSFTQWHKTTLM